MTGGRTQTTGICRQEILVLEYSYHFEIWQVCRQLYRQKGYHIFFQSFEHIFADQTT